MVSIKNVLVPFRLDLRKKEPVSLRVEITNDETETKLFSIKLLVSKALSVESTGISNIKEMRLGEIAPGDTKLLYFDIYSKVPTNPNAQYPARIVLYEHYNDYEFIGKEYKKDFVVKTV